MPIKCRADAEAVGMPVVECHNLPQREGWACDIWVVPKCPFCGKRHSHGSGEGLRTAHCTDSYPRDSYYLVERSWNA